MSKKEVTLVFCKGIVPESKLDSIKYILEETGITFEIIDISNMPQANLEELNAPILLCLSSPVVKSLLVGLSTAFFYDLLKKCVLILWRNISGKKISKITTNSIETMDADLDLEFTIREGQTVKFKLKGDIPNYLKDKYIDKAFQVISSGALAKIDKKYVCIFNTDNNEWKAYEELEFVRKFIVPKNAEKI